MSENLKSNFKTENDLEIYLVKSANDPAHRPQFYKDFIDSDIFIIQPIRQKEGKHTFTEGETLEISNIEINGKQYIPIFSSLLRIQTIIQEEVSFIKINTLEFLNIVKGAEIWLNPGSDYGKEFLNSEIEKLLDGTIWQRTNKIQMAKDTPIEIGQPKIYPHELVKSLSKLFEGFKEVNHAYLAHYYDPSQDIPPHTVIAIKATGNYEEIISQAGIIASSLQIPNPPVDFFLLEGKIGLDSYFVEIKPFYKKK